MHVPAGGIPKDGPSAGCAMTTALVSLLTGRRVRHDLAMTGEITLRGHVMPIGGVKEKVLAAHRAGCKQVILPDRNRKDLGDIPEEITKELQIHFCKRIEEVLALALEEAPATDRTDTPSGDVSPSMKASSMATDPYSFTSTAHFSAGDLRRSRSRTAVVLPTPRKPVTSVVGMGMGSSGSTTIPRVRRSGDPGFGMQPRRG